MLVYLLCVSFNLSIMKNVFSVFFLGLLLLFGACSARYYQIYDVKGDNVEKMSDCLLFKDENCHVIYNFWCDGGTADFVIVNNTDSILYVNMEKSFFIRNGMALDYFENSTYVSGSVKAATLASFPSYTVSATVNGRNYGLAGNLPYSGVSYNIDAYVYDQGDNNSRYKFTVRPERPVLILPPHAAKLVSKFVLWAGDPYSDDVCGKDLMPADSVTHAYSLETSPLVFSNFITYSVGESGKERHIENRFYVSDITNVKGSEVLVEERIQCEGEPYPRTSTYIRGMDADRFYVKYSR